MFSTGCKTFIAIPNYTKSDFYGDWVEFFGIFFKNQKYFFTVKFYVKNIFLIKSHTQL
jgi:hypothetical protein